VLLFGIAPHNNQHLPHVVYTCHLPFSNAILLVHEHKLMRNFVEPLTKVFDFEIDSVDGWECCQLRKAAGGCMATSMKQRDLARRVDAAERLG
jgi:hypothetical protein